MTAKRTVRMIAIAALLLPAGASAQQYQQWQQQQNQGQAQRQSSDQQSIEQDVRSFLQQVEQSVTRAVQQGDENAIRQWTQNHVADSASFSVMMEVSGNGRTPKGMRVSVVDKQDMLRRQAAMMSLMPDVLNMVQNYDLSIRVLNVKPIGDNAAVVKTRISESATLRGRQFTAMSNQGQNQYRQSFNQSNQTAASGAGSGEQNSRSQQNQGQAGMRSISFNGVADCTQLIQRDQSSNRMLIGLSNCSAELSY